VLLGWCAGAVLAYDLAQQLVAQDESVALVAMVDPSAPVPIRSLGLRVVTAGQRLRAATVQRGAAVLQRFRRSAAAAAEQGLDIVDRKLVAYLERAADAYTPRRYGGKVLLFEPARAPAARLAGPVADWRALVPQASVHRVPGNHVTMLRDAGAQFIAERIGEALEEG
jgi:thioesterase domain-containing protein